jgi:hypothetical protein
MPVVKVYRNGMTAGVAPSCPVLPETERGIVQGWTKGSVRRNLAFLYSVDHTKLTGSGFALTLTLRDCPVSPHAWRSLYRAFFDRIRRLGMIRGHWVVEWQRRGVPHLHGSFYFPDALVARYAPGAFEELLRWAWVQVAASHGAALPAQFVSGIYDSYGWDEYVSKHAARGVNHYQRSPENIPQAWRETGTGRIWGKIGDWPIVDPIRLEVDFASYHRLRRIARGLRVADARRPVRPSNTRENAERDRRRRIRSARRMNACPDRDLSGLRGVSDFMSIEAQLQVLAYLASLGGEIQS